MIGSVSVVPFFLLPLCFLLHISNLPVVPAFPRKLTARSCSAAETRRCAADWVQDTTIVRTVCYQVNGGLWLEPITNWKSTSAVVAVLNERRVCLLGNPKDKLNKECVVPIFSTFEPTVLLVWCGDPFLNKASINISTKRWSKTKYLA